MRVPVLLSIGLLAALAHAQPVAIQAGTVTGVYPGQTFDVPILVNTDLTGLNVLSFQLSVTKPANCTFQSVIVEPGDLVQPWGTPATNAITTVLVSGAGAFPLIGSGTLLRLRFLANSAATTAIQFTPSTSNVLNEGSPVLSFTSGSVQVSSLPTINVSPTSSTLVIGQTLALTATGGTGPYTFSTLHPGVGSVSGSTWTSVGQGLGKAQAVAQGGFIGTTSGWYDVRTFDMDLGTATGYVTQELRVPLTIVNPSGASFYSGDLRIDGSTAISFEGLDASGYLLDGTTIQANTSGQYVYISFAGSSLITPTGAPPDTLCWLRFRKVVPTGSATYPLSIGAAQFDEVLNARVSTGSLTFQALPAIGITPSTGTLIAGQTQAFSATGAAVAPLAWEVTNPAVGSISAAGLFSATDGGTTLITLEDNISNTATSGTINVFDATLEVVNVNGPVGGQVWVPITTSPSLNNEDIFSFQLTFSFTTAQLSFQAWESAGSLSAGWLVFTNVSGSQVTVTAANATPIQPGGLLGYLRFQMQPAFIVGTGNVNIVSSLFNEGDPVMLHDNGVVTATISVAPRVFLEGPYSSATGLMSDPLRSAGLVPTTQPYTALGYSLVGGGSTTTSPAVLAVAGNDAIVDWVVVELRDNASPANVLASRSALVQRDGNVVDTDGISPVMFTLSAGTYRVAVRHRNHLGVMTLNGVAVTGAPSTVDLTTIATGTHGSAARKSVSGAFPAEVLWAGDVTFNGQIKYTGSANDRDPILTTVGSTTPNNTVVNTYSTRDVNMNGQVKYTGSANDRDPILVNVGSTTPNNVRVQQLP